MRLFILVLFAFAGCTTPAAVQPAETQPTVEAASTPEPEPESEPDGEQLYGQICVTCHGALGDGQGLEQELFSFGAPASEWKNGPTVAGITTTLSEGVHETSMQSFPNYGEAERTALAEYVLELRAGLIASP